MKTITTIALILITGCIAYAQNYSGTYSGTCNGSKVVCRITQQGQHLSATMKDELGTHLEFNGTVYGNTSEGSVIANSTYSLNYSATFSANGCTFVFSAPGSSQTESVTLSKGGATVQPVVNKVSTGGAIDQKMVGQWTKETITSTSGSSDYASFTSVTYFTYNADGTFCVKDGGAMGGGDSWSYSGGASGNSTCGTWYVKNGYFYSVENGKTYGPTKYTFSDGQLVFGEKGNYRFLSRN